jgi:ectoine hydroxylase-related dioxygenase (phytanoyl-CoA dioxygenase family)
MKPLIDAPQTAADPQALRDQADRDGYLFFRGLVDRDDVLDLRRRIGAILQDAGWLDPGTDATAALSTQPAVIEGDDAYFPVYHRIQKIRQFHALAHGEPLLKKTQQLFGEPPLVHPRKIARVMFPTTPVTQPHQDFVHILGSKRTWTAWLPLGDLTPNLGTLAVLPGSHVRGVLPLTPMAGAGGSGIDDCFLSGQWASAELQAGDVLMFHSHLVHRSTANTTHNRMRLSVDYRYQPASEPVEERSLEPHHGQIGWEQIYEQWEQEDGRKYYWRTQRLAVTKQPTKVPMP